MSRILAIDTATSRTVAALDGARLAADSGHRHGRELLRLIDELVGGPASATRRDLSGVVVGTGPGSFTGLRVGLATAKTIAHAFGLSIVGVPTSLALAVAASRHDPEVGQQGATSQPIAVLQPAGPGDRYLTLVRIDPTTGEAHLVEPPRILPPGSWEEAVDAGSVLVAVDLDEASDLPQAARALGRGALDGLARALLDLGGARLQSGDADDVAELVPVYVTLPRGVKEAAASVAWSPELR